MTNYMYRAMQNPDTPNLPFAQLLLPIMYRDMENEDTPNLPFSQGGRPSGKYVYYNYIVNGDHWTFGKMVNKKVRWTESNAQQYRAKGYSVVKVEDIGGDLQPKPPKPPKPPPTDKHGHVFETVHPKQTKQLVKMGFDLTDLGNKLTDALKHRTSIEGKVETIITQRQDVSKKLTNLGKSVTDVSSALEAHKLGHNGGWNPFGDIPMWVAIGGLALFMVIKR